MRKSTLAVLCAIALGACAWGNGSGSNPPPPDAATAHAVCGDGTCAASEVGNCPQDCGTAPKCGNGTCDAGESNATCPADCPPAVAMCGDGTCNGTEDPTTCPGDCPPPAGLDCTNPIVLISCLLCTQDNTQCAALMVDPAGCAVCTGP